MRQKAYFWNPAACSYENGKCERSIGDPVVICVEIIKETKTIPTKTSSAECTSSKTFPAKHNLISFHILLTFY